MDRLGFTESPYLKGKPTKVELDKIVYLYLFERSQVVTSGLLLISLERCNNVDEAIGVGSEIGLDAET